MSVTLTIEQGDHLPAIAEEHGFADWHTIWDAPENADLRKKRDQPGVLHPGDQLVIPDKQPKSVSVPTGATHTFTLKGETSKLVLDLVDLAGQPLKSTSLEVTIDGKTTSFTTDGNGRLEVPMPAGAREGHVKGAGFDHTLRIGHLDPVEERSGLLARLRNLGLLAEADDSLVEDDDLAFALSLFQRQAGLTVDGSASPATLAKLKDLYGC